MTALPNIAIPVIIAIAATSFANSIAPDAIITNSMFRSNFKY